MKNILHFFGIHFSVPVYVGGSGRMIGYFCGKCGAPMIREGRKALGPNIIAQRCRPRDNEV